MIILSTTDPLCVVRYSCSQEYDFTLGFGQCFGQNWIYVEEEFDMISESPYDLMEVTAPEHAQSMKEIQFGAASLHYGNPSPWILRTSCIMWKSSRLCGVKLEVFQDPGFGDVSGEWTGFDIDVSKFFLCMHITISLVTVYTGNRGFQP